MNLDNYYEEILLLVVNVLFGRKCGESFDTCGDGECSLMEIDAREPGMVPQVSEISGWG